ncbi:MAG: nuclear transport factor 2 family protein [Acidobacteriota bacterium]|jgi:predicted ester cyclase
MADDRILELYRREADSGEYSRIRALWKAHSIAEDDRDIPGLMATLTDDCLYEIPQTGDAWHGKEGAERFYRDLLSAFPDVHFDLQNIVIGPQGVFEEAHVTGTHARQWLNYEPSGRKTEFYVLIYFPWDSEAARFSGERISFWGFKPAAKG